MQSWVRPSNEECGWSNGNWKNIPRSPSKGLSVLRNQQKRIRCRRERTSWSARNIRLTRTPKLESYFPHIRCYKIGNTLQNHSRKNTHRLVVLETNWRITSVGTRDWKTHAHFHSERIVVRSEAKRLCRQTNRSPSEMLGKWSVHQARRDGHSACLQIGRHLRCRVRSEDAVLLQHVWIRERKCSFRKQKSNCIGKRPEPHWSRNWVRLLVCARCACGEGMRIWNHHDQLQSGNRFNRLRHSRQVVFRTRFLGTYLRHHSSWKPRGSNRSAWRTNSFEAGCKTTALRN